MERMIAAVVMAVYVAALLWLILSPWQGGQSDFPDGPDDDDPLPPPPIDPDAPTHLARCASPIHSSTVVIRC